MTRSESDAAGGRDLPRLIRAVRWLDRQAERPGFYPKVGLFPLLDYAVPVMPNHMLLIALAYLHPARWLAVAATFALASALGAMGVALVVQGIGGGIAGWLTGNVETAGTAFDLIEAHGIAALTALALLPVPPRTAVLLCALAGLPALQIGAAVAAGRLVPAGLLAWVAANSPNVLRRVPTIACRIDALEASRATVA